MTNHPRVELELFLNFIGIRMDSRMAEGMWFTINLSTPDNDEKFIIEMENATLTNIKGFLASNPDLPSPSTARIWSRQ